MKNDQITSSADGNSTEMGEEMEYLKDAAEEFGHVFASTMGNAIQSGKNFEDTLRSIALRLSELALQKAFDPIEEGLSGLLSSFVTGDKAGLTSLFGSNGAVPTPFAKGGVVSSPVAFNFGQRLGVMGEAGPEAVMPLTRTADGRLGVASASSGAAPNIVFNVSANDAGSFRKSEAQVTAMLARAVKRGQRGL